MPKFSVEKIQEIRRSKNLTYDEISKLSGISKSAVSKVFGGFQENPTAAFLEKMAKIFDCGIDEFFTFENEPKSPYYTDRKTAETAQKIENRPDLRLFLDVVSTLNKEDFTLLFQLAKRLSI